MLLLIEKKTAIMLKSHIQGYTKKDGTFVASHEDSRKLGVQSNKHNNKLNNMSEEDHDELITKIVEEAEKRGLSHFGVRVITKHQKGKSIYKVGDSMKPSYVWVDGSSTKEKLSGVSTIKIDYDGFNVENIDKTLSKLEPYLGDNEQVVLVGGTDSYEGNDRNERVIENAEVLHVF